MRASSTVTKTLTELTVTDKLEGMSTEESQDHCMNNCVSLKYVLVLEIYMPSFCILVICVPIYIQWYLGLQA